jgi:hypothetical protein
MSMGQPTQQEIDLLDMMIEQGATPQQAINQIAIANPNRFISPEMYDRQIQQQQQQMSMAQFGMQQQGMSLDLQTQSLKNIALSREL